jgi:hypothetical protein
LHHRVIVSLRSLRLLWPSEAYLASYATRALR